MCSVFIEKVASVARKCDGTTLTLPEVTNITCLFLIYRLLEESHQWMRRCHIKMII
jgi:hypothetical protein